MPAMRARLGVGQLGEGARVGVCGFEPRHAAALDPSWPCAREQKPLSVASRRWACAHRIYGGSLSMERSEFGAAPWCGSCPVVVQRLAW